MDVEKRLMSDAILVVVSGKSRLDKSQARNRIGARTRKIQSKLVGFRSTSRQIV